MPVGGRVEVCAWAGSRTLFIVGLTQDLGRAVAIALNPMIFLSVVRLVFIFLAPLIGVL